MNLHGEKAVKENYNRFSYRFSWFHLIRPMTFTGTISPILAGTALAAKKGPVHMDVFIALLIASLLVQSTINMLNDYYDFQHGQDLEKWTVSGDQIFRNIPSYPVIPFVAGAMVVTSGVIGIWLAIHSNYWILLIGVLGLIFGYSYSGGPRPLSSIGLGELTAAIFLGFVPAGLAYVIQGHSLNTSILAVSFIFALLISSMILTNNIRDMEKDKAFRLTLAMILGRKVASRLLTILLSLSYLFVIGLILFNVVSWMSGMIFLALPLAVKLHWSLRLGAKRMDEINGMKLAAWHHWAFGLLLACGMWLESY